METSAIVINDPATSVITHRDGQIISILNDHPELSPEERSQIFETLDLDPSLYNGFVAGEISPAAVLAYRKKVHLEY